MSHHNESRTRERESQSLSLAISIACVIPILIATAYTVLIERWRRARLARACRHVHERRQRSMRALGDAYIADITRQARRTRKN